MSFFRSTATVWSEVNFWCCCGYFRQISIRIVNNNGVCTHKSVCHSSIQWKIITSQFLSNWANQNKVSWKINRCSGPLLSSQEVQNSFHEFNVYLIDYDRTIAAAYFQLPIVFEFCFFMKRNFKTRNSHSQTSTTWKTYVFLMSLFECAYFNW